MTDPIPVGAAIPATLLERLAEKAPVPYAGSYDLTETEEEATERRQLARGAARSRWESRCPVMYRDANVRNLEADQGADAIAAWVRDPEARHLILAGRTGAGKTYAAYAVGNLLVDTGTVEAWTVHDLLEAMRPNGESAPHAPKVDVLLLDDLGATKPTEWAIETLTAILDERLREDRRTIVTTNLDATEIAAAWGDRLVDRLRHKSTAVVMTGQSRRVAAW